MGNPSSLAGEGPLHFNLPITPNQLSSPSASLDPDYRYFPYIG